MELEGRGTATGVFFGRRARASPNLGEYLESCLATLPHSSPFTMSTSPAQPAPELSSRKRKKVSGLTSFELSMMYEYIQKIRSGVADLPDDDDDLQHDLERVLEKVQAKLSTPKVVFGTVRVPALVSPARQHTPFSSVNTELLNHLQATPAGELSLRNDISGRVEQSKLLGADKFMSSTTMHSLLQLLEDHTILSVRPLI